MAADLHLSVPTIRTHLAHLRTRELIRSEHRPKIASWAGWRGQADVYTLRWIPRGPVVRLADRGITVPGAWLDAYLANPSRAALRLFVAQVRGACGKRHRRGPETCTQRVRPKLVHRSGISLREIPGTPQQAPARRAAVENGRERAAARHRQADARRTRTTTRAAAPVVAQATAAHVLDRLNWTVKAMPTRRTAADEAHANKVRAQAAAIRAEIARAERSTPMAARLDAIFTRRGGSTTDDP